MVQLGLLSACLLDVHEGSSQYAPERFLEHSLSRVCATFDVDKAWWGIMSVKRGQFLLHASWRQNLPESFEPMWEELKQDDALARGVSLKPGQAVNLNEVGFRSFPGLAVLMGEHNISNALCTSAFFPEQDAFMFLSLYRKKGGFDDASMQTSEVLMPHLFSAWRNNLRQGLRPAPTMLSSTVYRGFISGHGRLLDAEAGFKELVQQIWPGKSYKSIDGYLCALAQQSIEQINTWVRHGELMWRAKMLGAVCLIELRLCTPLDELSARESSIVYQYSVGASHKQIARELNISPSTVRHHLRNAYLKLGVSDKGALATLLHETAYA